MQVKIHPSTSSQWAIAIETAGSSQGSNLTISVHEQEFLTLALIEKQFEVCLTARISPNKVFAGKDCLDFSLHAPASAMQLRLEWLGYSVRLYADDQLADEDWPLGQLPAGEWHVASNLSYHFTEPNEQASQAETQLDGPLQYFTWPGENTGVGDCMPFARDGRYCLYFLFDRRGHRSKGGLGAHQWAQISSADLKTWTLHPMAVPITEQWEGSICTGSLIQKDGWTHAFYAARMADGSPARMTWASSPDGVHFTKSGACFALTDPYEPVSARDPMVFLGADGQYHMLVTTSLANEDRYGGCLAHMTSPDLRSWVQQPKPFIVPGFADQPECSDYFEWNGIYYLVFSNFATARYRFSKHPFGPWEKPAHDVLDSVENQVVKTAAFQNRRLMTGFLARIPRTYAGNAVTHELVQRDDGTLGVKFCEEILPAQGRAMPIADTHISSTEGRAMSELAKSISNFRLRMEVEAPDERSIYGLSLRLREREYRIDFAPSAKMVSVLRPHQYFALGEVRNQLTGVDLPKRIGIDLIVFGDILDLVLSNGRCITMRLDACLPSAELSAFVQTGAIKLKNVQLCPIDA